MRKMKIRLLAVVLVMAMLLGGCSLEGLVNGLLNQIQMGLIVPFSDMEYARPELSDFQQMLEDTLAQAQTETDVDRLMEKVYGLYEFYYDFSTNYNLANIRYSQNVKDIYWEQEYSWCLQKSNEVSAGMDRLLYALADCPLREELEGDSFFGEGFFDMYDGESLWDETFTALMDQESTLVNRYYELNAQASETEYYSEAYFTGVGAQIEDVFVELVEVRQQIAEYAGYESYPDFAYEFYHYRDYTPAQAQVLLEQISVELTPLYRQLDESVWAPMMESCTEKQMLDYLRQCVDAVGGTAKDAFRVMEKAGLYDIAYSEDKYDASFEVFLLNYYVPFVFVCPQGNGRDMLTFTHEFGHFCNDYAVGGTVAGVDVAEVFSQGLEYLSLCYGEDTQELTRMKMADSLCTFVEQAAYASFELQVYALEEPTVENVRKVYQQVGDAYGFDVYERDYRDYTLIPHLFIAPMYVVSYVVSNDAAMQIYQRELEETGAGLALWENGLYTMQMGYVGFLEEMGLESSFTEGRVAKLRQTLEEKLK